MYERIKETTQIKAGAVSVFHKNNLFNQLSRGKPTRYRTLWILRGKPFDKNLNDGVTLMRNFLRESQIIF